MVQLGTNIKAQLKELAREALAVSRVPQWKNLGANNLTCLPSQKAQSPLILDNYVPLIQSHPTPHPQPPNSQGNKMKDLFNLCH